MIPSKTSTVPPTQTGDLADKQAPPDFSNSPEKAEWTTAKLFEDTKAQMEDIRAQNQKFRDMLEAMRLQFVKVQRLNDSETTSTSEDDPATARVPFRLHYQRKLFHLRSKQQQLLARQHGFRQYYDKAPVAPQVHLTKGDVSLDNTKYEIAMDKRNRNTNNNIVFSCDSSSDTHDLGSPCGVTLFNRNTHKVLQSAAGTLTGYHTGPFRTSPTRYNTAEQTQTPSTTYHALPVRTISPVKTILHQPQPVSTTPVKIIPSKLQSSPEGIETTNNSSSSSSGLQSGLIADDESSDKDLSLDDHPQTVSMLQESSRHNVDSNTTHGTDLCKFILLRAPENSMCSFNDQAMITMPSEAKGSLFGSTDPEFSVNFPSRSSRGWLSPCLFASSKDINDLYTSSPRLLQDISPINRSGVVDSPPVQGPLNSSIINTSFNKTLVQDFPDAENTSDVNEDTSHMVRISGTPPSSKNCFDSTFHTPNNPIPKGGIRRQVIHARSELCVEHGLHPTFGGPCIFDGSLTNGAASEDSELEFHGSAHRANPTASQQISLVSSSILTNQSSVLTVHSTLSPIQVNVEHIQETDCDSSYLSECVDEPLQQLYHGTASLVPAATSDYETVDTPHKQPPQHYTSSNESQDNTLKGQATCALSDTYQTDLDQTVVNDSTPSQIRLSNQSSAGKDAVNESDVHKTYIITDCSMAAMRSSPVNIHDLTAVVNLNTRLNASIISTLDNTRSTTVNRQIQKSSSTSTTNTGSPESQGPLPVPVNSPNMTDSSSSRQKLFKVTSHKKTQYRRSLGVEFGGSAKHLRPQSACLDVLTAQSPINSKAYASSTEGRMPHGTRKTLQRHHAFSTNSNQVQPSVPHKRPSRRPPFSENDRYQEVPHDYPAVKHQSPYYGPQLSEVHLHKSPVLRSVDNFLPVRSVNLDRVKKKSLSRKFKQFHKNLYGNNAVGLTTLAHF